MDTIYNSIIQQISAIFTKQGRPVPKDLSMDTNLSGMGIKTDLQHNLESEHGIHFTDNHLPETIGEITSLLHALLEDKKRKANRIVTIPNILSLFRLILIPVYVVLYAKAETPKDYLGAGIILAVSCVTDLFDGYIARHFDQISNLGKVLDPIADKATQGVMLICIAKYRPVIWWLLGFFIIKEGFQLVMGCWYLRKGQMLPGALMSGKICTTVVFISMILLVLFPGMPGVLATLLIIICAFFLLVSFVSYINAYFGKTKKVEKL